MESSRPAETDTDERLAHRLRALRLERGWSLDDLTTRSGVSRATLSRMENKEVSPTAAVLGRLCAAFEMTLSRLMAQVEPDPAARIAPDDQPVWTDPETGFRRRSISPPAADFECELLRCELPAGAEILYPSPPRRGLEHHLYLEDGALEVTLDGKVHALRPGDCLRYRLFGASGFRAGDGGPARYYLVVR
jgi:transcriptional regulator with XRE-family HTH domain